MSQQGTLGTSQHHFEGAVKVQADNELVETGSQKSDAAES